MKATPSQQRNLATFEEGIDALGGDMLDEYCASAELPPVSAGSGPPGLEAKLNVLVGYTCGCGERERAELPYTAENDRPSRANVCGVCDAGYNFPRVLAAAAEAI